jgi:mannose-6-phosphate isomerase-like protein (cupin superfamily)
MAGKRAAGKQAPAGNADRDGKIVEVLARSDAMEGLLVTVEPGSDWGEAYSHPGEEIRYILEGSLEVDIGGKKYVLKKGDCLWHTADVPHTLRNPGKRKARYFVVIIPPSFS